MPKRYITVQLEVDYDIDEDFDPTESHYPEIIESVLPVFVEHTLTPGEKQAVFDYIRHGEDADYDIMWRLGDLLKE